MSELSGTWGWYIFFSEGLLKLLLLFLFARREYRLRGDPVGFKLISQKEFWERFLGLPFIQTRANGEVA